MSYLSDVQEELLDLLGQQPINQVIHHPEGTPEYEEAVKEFENMDQEWEDKVVKFVKEKILESFKNGAQTERNKRKSKYQNKKGASK